jgi:hypothetical protein
LNGLGGFSHFYAFVLIYLIVSGRFSVVFTPFKLFSINLKGTKTCIFGQTAWTIAHGFDRFWVIFTPFKLFSIYLKGTKNMHF